MSGAEVARGGSTVWELPRGSGEVGIAAKDLAPQRSGAQGDFEPCPSALPGRLPAGQGALSSSENLSLCVPAQCCGTVPACLLQRGLCWRALPILPAGEGPAVTI